MVQNDPNNNLEANQQIDSKLNISTDVLKIFMAYLQLKHNKVHDVSKISPEALLNSILLYDESDWVIFNHFLNSGVQNKIIETLKKKM